MNQKQSVTIVYRVGQLDVSKETYDAYLKQFPNYPILTPEEARRFSATPSLFFVDQSELQGSRNVQFVTGTDPVNKQDQNNWSNLYSLMGKKYTKDTDYLYSDTRFTKGDYITIKLMNGRIVKGIVTDGQFISSNVSGIITVKLVYSSIYTSDLQFSIWFKDTEQKVKIVDIFEAVNRIDTEQKRPNQKEDGGSISNNNEGGGRPFPTVTKEMLENNEENKIITINKAFVPWTRFEAINYPSWMNKDIVQYNEINNKLKKNDTPSIEEQTKGLEELIGEYDTYNEENKRLVRMILETRDVLIGVIDLPESEIINEFRKRVEKEKEG